YYEDNTIKEKRTVVLNELSQPLSTNVQHYNRDNYGRLSSVSLNGQPLVALGYDINGQVELATFAAGERVAFSYDELSRRFVGMNQSASRWAAANSHRLNARGFISRETISVNDLILFRDYGYSPPGFLTSAADAQTTTTYRYEFDAFGLPTAIERNGNREELIRLGDTLAVGDTVFRFDQLGRTTEKGDLRFIFGPAGNVATAQR